MIDLEPIWHGRQLDVLEGKEFLRAVDLSNQKTDLAHHNKVKLPELLSQFEKTRNDTVHKLKKLDAEAIYLSALHPRLEQPMRIMDLFLFVAEHDDHHLARINEINANHNKM